MKLYLDDDSASPLLARLFNQAGHDVQLPRDAGLDGADDPVHLTHTIREDRVCLSGNHDDFLVLHNLVMEAQGHHPGNDVCITGRINSVHGRHQTATRGDGRADPLGGRNRRLEWLQGELARIAA